MKSISLSLLFTLLCGFAILPTTAFAQRTCGADAIMDNIRANDPEQAARMDAIQRRIFQEAKSIQSSSRMDEVYLIPVVFHVVWNDSSENVSDAQLHSQIDVLNEDFRRLNADTINTPSAFRALAEDSKIEFCLASFDPAGNPTTGITRTFTNRNSFSLNDAVKSDASGGKSPWPRDQYLNFWVCNLSGGILGYAFPPGSTPAEDGVVCHYTYTGRVGNINFPFHLGRTATHEVGHWLGLRHLWGVGGCSNDDGIADTPSQSSPNYGCQNFPSISCSNGPNGDQFMNYMDYSDDVCFNMFSQGQIAVMRQVLGPSGFRSSLQQASSCVNLAYNNIGIDTILSPIDENCDGNISVEVVLSNYGENLITEAPIFFTLDGTPIWFTVWTGVLDSGSTATIVHLPANISPGTHTLAVYTDGVNSENDSDVSNDTAYKTFDVLSGHALPFADGFEDPLYPQPEWELINPDSALTWQRIEGISRWGTASVWMNNYDYPSAGEMDEFILPMVDLTTFTPTGAGLSFYLSYAQTFPLSGASDTLQVWVSNDCGETYEMRYQKAGSDLVTTGPSEAAYVPEFFWQWRKEWVDLSDLTDFTSVMVKFRNITSSENNVYLDNINIGVLHTVGIDQRFASGQVQLFPNPARDMVTVSIDAVNRTDVQLSLRDVAGRAIVQREVAIQQGFNQIEIPVHMLASGVYFVEIQDDKGKFVEKLIIL
ncbi:MAG: M43 family zinc metalloprotease [Bacteroidota bacterium]